MELVQSQPPLQFSGTGPVTERQEKSHPHQVYGVTKSLGDNLSVDEILIPDLGADKIWRLKQSAEGKWEKKEEITLDDKHLGGGPRHVIVKSKQHLTLLLFFLITTCRLEALHPARAEQQAHSTFI